MQYSFALAALGASAVMAALQPAGQITDGQIQISTGAVEAATPVTSAPVEEETVYSTKHIVITSCGPEVVSCPARSHHTTSTVIPIVVSKSSAPVVVASSTSTPVVASTPNSPIVPESSAPAVSSVVVASTPNSPAVPVSSAPAEVSVPAVSTCPPAVTVTLTVTATPEASAPAASVPAGSAPAVAASSVPAVVVASSAPGAPVESSTPSTPNSPAQASGVAGPSGTAASTGVVSYQPSSSPITPFKGAANTVGSSIAMAGVAAFAAIFLA